MNETVKDIAADIGLVRLGVVETLADADFADLAEKALPSFASPSSGLTTCIHCVAEFQGALSTIWNFSGVTGTIGQRADGGRLVFGMVVQLRSR